MDNYKQAQIYLDSFINYEKKVFFPYRKVLKLERVRYIFQKLSVPYQDLKVIHIAGTKGKGSTAAFCADLLAASGFRVGLYTSPHFLDMRERIKIVTGNFQPGGSMISKKDFVRILEGIKPVLENLEQKNKPTFFEVYTFIAFKYFLEKKVDFAVLETGLGGRLDATNIVTPLVSIITRIGYDHTNKLGTTLGKIAYEKAGIIKKTAAVVCGAQRKTAMRVIANKCRETGSPLFLYNRDFSAENIKVNRTDTSFSFRFFDRITGNLKISLKGRVQTENASLAIAALFLLKEKGLIHRINLKCIENTFLEGRFEIVKNNPLMILDVAHNQSSFLVLKENLKRYFSSKKIILIFAASKDKNVRAMLNEIEFSQLIITRFNTLRSFSPEEIKQKINKKKCFIAENIEEALKIAGRIFDKKSLILISGSFFLVAEAKQLLCKIS